MKARDLDGPLYAAHRPAQRDPTRSSRPRAPRQHLVPGVRARLARSSTRSRRRRDTVIVCVNVDPRAHAEGVAVVPPELGLPASFTARDLLTGDAVPRGSTGRELPAAAARRRPRARASHERDRRSAAAGRAGRRTPPSRPSPTARTHSSQWLEPDPTWFRHAVFYEVHVRAFADGNDDGIGDFVGLTERLDYLHWLGVDCIWLLPMYTSPLRDGGYDISDFYSVHPDYGTLDDFAAFVAAAHERGIRVIADLVMNHTSIDHPWFQESRARSRLTETRLVRVVRRPTHGTATRGSSSSTPRSSNWTWDPVGERLLLAPLLLASAGPQLRQPRRRDEMLKVMHLLARRRPRRLPPRRGAVSLRARRHDLREPARDARLPQAGPQGSRRALSRPRAPRGGQPVAAKTSSSTSARATNATWRSTSR